MREKQRRQLAVRVTLRAASGNCIEPMEPRLLLSAIKASHATHAHHAKPKKVISVPKHHPVHQAAVTAAAHIAVPTGIDLGPAPVPTDVTASDTPATGPFTPAEIRHFYGMDSVSFGSTAGDGAGETIGIVDAYDQPDMLDSTDPNFATSDLAEFDQMFHLPDPPSFTKVDEYGGTDLPTTYNANWAGEISLDVEWAHAMAPAASIVLVECNAATYDDLLTNGAATAGSLANVVSMSFGGSEFNGDSYYDSAFTSSSTPTRGVTFLASAGDTGSDGTNYPAFSPDVVAVGGTSITTSSSNASYGSETVWNDRYGATGGAISNVTDKPSYQSNIALGGTARVVPDVAFDADPATGFYVYDSSQSPSRQLYEYGGTSVSSPCWAGIIAVADQGRAIVGLPSLDGPSQTLPRLYQLPSTDFHDITTGDNSYPNYQGDGYYAGVGYDACTGLGTPIASSLIPDLAGADTVSGRVFQDNNANGIFDGTDSPLAGQTVYLDLNGNRMLDADEPSTVTDLNGNFSFPDQIGGEAGNVLLANPVAGDVIVPESTSFATSYGSAQSVNQALFPMTYTDTSGTTVYDIALNSAGTTVQISVNGVLTYSAPASLAPSYAFNLTGSGDSLIVDGTDGNPIPAGGATLTGATGGDNLSVIGTAIGNDAFTVTSSSIAFGNRAISFSNVANLLLNPGAGVDSLAVNSGSVTITAPNAGAGIITRQFSSITVATSAQAVFADAALQSDRMLVITSALSVNSAATVDLGDNDMIIHNGDLTALTGLLAAGFNSGSWNGSGIASSAAAGDSTYRTALGVLLNNNGAFGGSTLFDGYSPSSTDVLIKFTYYGDANLDGAVDGSDYSLTDNGFHNQLTSWQSGNFNYDASVDGSDYSLIDNTYNTQSAPL